MLPSIGSVQAFTHIYVSKPESFTQMTHPTIPIDTKPLFRPLHEKLIDLLKSLNEDDWQRQTVAKEWKVKDVVSHLLDGHLRALSIQRDRFFGETPPSSDSYQDVVKWLNALNADWVKATRRLSPGIMIFLLETIGPLVIDYYDSLEPWDEAIFPVAWAGQDKSYNWMHLAREYTEYWHHQQQVREAVGQTGIMTPSFFYPVMDTFFQALPHTFQEVVADRDTVIETTVLGEAGGSWYLAQTESGWKLSKEAATSPIAIVRLPQELAWVLFSKSKRPKDIMADVQIGGDTRLAMRVLEMVAVMA